MALSLEEITFLLKLNDQYEAQIEQAKAVLAVAKDEFVIGLAGELIGDASEDSEEIENFLEANGIAVPEDVAEGEESSEVEAMNKVWNGSIIKWR